eukprot:COSAG02_NODE_33483_length_499_cov_0.980000_1_plen_100_part_10
MRRSLLSPTLVAALSRFTPRALASTGTGKAPRALAVVLDADFDADVERGGSIRSGQTVLTAGRASRRAAAVAGEYAAAMRADAASDQSFQPPSFEFKGHR